MVSRDRPGQAARSVEPFTLKGYSGSKFLAIERETFREEFSLRLLALR